MSAAVAGTAGATGVLRVANCSGFFGDRAGAAREVVEGGPVDVLTGDWLAELTMYILHKTRQRSGGFARTFLRELEAVLPTCVERGITVVSNAGGLDPEALAVAVRELGSRQGVEVRVASVSGDDVTPRLGELRAGGEAFVNLDTGEALPEDAAVVTANAYLRARPISDALAAGAQVVVTGRVTDAALVVGPAMHAFGWADSDLDAIAGAVVAGHVIECGAQCCGGNYAFFDQVPGRERIGFPLAEVHADGSSVITKHPGTGGMVTVGTVTAQLLYEIGGPRYLSPDAVARFDTIALAQEGPDRVRISGVRGEPPPDTLKVTANLDGGWRNSMTLALTGDQVGEKARFAADAVWAGVPGGRDAFSETEEQLTGDLDGGGMAYLRLAVRGDDEHAVGRAFSDAVIETSLSSYPGTFFTSPPSRAQGVARYWPTTVAASAVTPLVVCEGTKVPVTPQARQTAPVTERVASPPAGHAAATGRRDGGGGRAARRPGRGSLGRQGGRREHRPVGRRGRRRRMAAGGAHRRTAPVPAARSGAVRHQPARVGEPPRGQFRGARDPGLGRGVEPPPGHPGQGSGRDAAGAAGARPGRARRRWRPGGASRRALSGPTAVPALRGNMGVVETVARPVALAAGILLVALTVWSVFSALVVPRVTSSAAMRGLARFLGWAAKRLAPRLRTYEGRDRAMSYVGPAAMVSLFVVWLCLLVLGIALIEWWAAGVDFARALGISGSSVFTLGIVSSDRAGPRAVEVVAAGVGLLVVALEIAYLPALYSQFSARETEVTLLEARSGNPAWGPEILARHHWLDTMDELPPLYADWERWAAAVSESHANYPALIWFRSPVPTRSWLVALVAMMDSAALFHAVSPDQAPRQARLCLRMGITCLRSMARALRIPYDEDPLPTADIRLTRAEFDDGYGRLAALAFPVERDVGEAWRHFQGWRVNYEAIADALADLVVPPPAPWFPDRPELGAARHPLVMNRTPDQPGGAQWFGSSKTLRTPSDRESNNS